MGTTNLSHRAGAWSLWLVCVCALTACAGLSGPAAEPARTGFSLTSPGRADNAMLTQPFGGKYAANPNCAGENVSPALAWARVPTGTRSLAILVDDQAGRAGLGVTHWVAYGIAPELGGFAEGEASAPSTKFVFGRNSLGAQAFLGPCPPRGNAPQHFVYTLIATSLEPSALVPGLTKAQMLEALNGKTLAAASLVLRFAQ